MKAILLALLLSGCAVEAAKPELCSATWELCSVGDGQPGEPVITCESDGGYSYCTCAGHVSGKPVIEKCKIDLHPDD